MANSLISGGQAQIFPDLDKNLVGREINKHQLYRRDRKSLADYSDHRHRIQTPTLSQAGDDVLKATRIVGGAVVVLLAGLFCIFIHISGTLIFCERGIDPTTPTAHNSDLRDSHE